MSQAYQPYDARLLQGGMLSGFQLAQSADQFNRRRLLEEQQFAFDVEQARQRVAESLAQRQRDEKIYRHLANARAGGVVAGPRPQQVAQGGEPASFTGTLGGAQQQAMPQGQAATMAPFDPLEGLDPETIIGASDHARGIIGKMSSDRAAYEEKRAKVAMAIQIMQPNGGLKGVPEKTWDEWRDIAPDLTNQVPIEDMPIQARERRLQEEEAARLEQVISLSGGPDGSFDFAKFSEYMPQDAKRIGAIYQANEIGKMAAARKQQLQAETAAAKQAQMDAGTLGMQRLRSGTSKREGTVEQDYAAARAAGLVNQEDVNISGESRDRYVIQKANALVSDAEADLKAAEDRVRMLADKEDQTMQTAAKGVGAGTLSAARAEVDNARARVMQARKQRDAMLSGGGQPKQTGQPDKIDALISELLGR